MKPGRRGLYYGKLSLAPYAYYGADLKIRRHDCENNLLKRAWFKIPQNENKIIWAIP
jgi:hypothetical protein